MALGAGVPSVAPELGSLVLPQRSSGEWRTPWLRDWGRGDPQWPGVGALSLPASGLPGSANRAAALSGAVVVGAGRRSPGRVHVGGGCGSGGGSGGGGGAHCMVVRVRVCVRVVAVAAQTGQRVGCRPTLCPEVVIVGGGRVLVGVVMQRLRRARRLQAQLRVRGAGSPSGRAGQ